MENVKTNKLSSGTKAKKMERLSLMKQKRLNLIVTYNGQKMLCKETSNFMEIYQAI